ncbi:DinB family protein [Fictibacillus enclensis]|nr:DinB family protein [Fictibacillus enclensis]MDM5339104.1 DinB family protein [Fictibacillus enclensis]
MKFKRLKELSDDVYHQEIQSVFPSILKVVSHRYIVDQLWFHIISGKDMPIGSRERNRGRVQKIVQIISFI